ncbi:hypothetical protein FH972_026597 [Carpinus fangiana]|uniref:RING-type domain-containing protein n=1 Tax=Carpinus fangiana TaxID=176857 RepID=A0A5N6L4H5_9ROSI|nr:hypothetical protein FH972_026597 [Carpinus fangiana]
MPHAPSSQRYGPRRRASRSAPLSISSDSDNDEEPPSKVRRTVAPHSPSFPSAVFPQTDLNGTKASPIVVADNGMAESKPPSQTEIGVAPTPRAIFLRDLLKLALDLAPSDVSRRHIYLLCLQAAGHGHRGDVDGAAHAAAWVFDQIHQQPDYPRESNTCVISITTPNAASAFTSWPNSWMQLQYRDAYFLLAREALKQEFPQFAPSYIEFILLYKGSLYLAMLALKEHIQQKALLPTWERLDFDPFRLGFLPSLLPGSDGVFLHQERHAAKQLNRASMKQPSLHGTTDQAQLVEDDSMDGEVECSCCCTDTSSSRAIHCSGDQSHFFCQDCVRSYVDNEIGNARCRPICFAVGFECRASISDQQLRRCLLPATLDLILEQQLNDDMKQMSNLVFAECPFCNYKEEVDAAFENRWFTCKNTKCMVVSCRSCLEVAHIPKSCEEVRAERKNSTRDQKLGQRHIMEEAMTEALMRKCNQCKTPFVKVDGCNKMTCPRQTCRNVQW